MSSAEQRLSDTGSAVRPMAGRAADQPFFICGVPRSGTSLLSRMLDRHSRLAIPFETGLFRDFLPLVGLYGDLSERPNQARLVDDILSHTNVKDFEPRLDRDAVVAAIKRPDFGGVFDAILTCWATAQGKPRWGEKTPQNAYRWTEIEGYFPTAKVIFIVRDGRDVALSITQARFGQATIFAAARRWAADLQQMERVRGQVPEDRFLRIRYEDLLARPESALTEVCAFLGESFEPEMLSFHDNQTTYASDPINAANLRKPLLRDNVGKWRTVWQARDVRIFESIAGDALVRYGYSRELDEAKLSAWEKFYFGLVDARLRKLIRAVKNRHSQIYYLKIYVLRLRLMLRRRFR